LSATQMLVFVPEVPPRGISGGRRIEVAVARQGERS
jgi:hypothetical protein